MKAFIASFAFIAMCSAQAQEAVQYKIEPKESKIVYVGKKVVTGMHTGELTIKSGHISVQGEKIVGGEVVVDMNSITSTDLTDKNTNAKFVGHMKSADFFDTAKFPESKINIKSSKPVAGGQEVLGDMTILGKTNPITFIVKDIKQDSSSFSAKSDMAVDRTKWGIEYASGSFIKNLGDKAISDEFTLSVSIKAKK